MNNIESKLEEFNVFTEENKKGFEDHVKKHPETYLGLHPITKNRDESLWLLACTFKDSKYFELSANQCVHPTSLDAEEGVDGVICRKHLRITELEKELFQQKFNNKHNLSIDSEVSNKIIELEDKLSTVEHQRDKAENRRDWLQREISSILEAAKSELTAKDKRIAFLETETTRLFDPVRKFWNDDMNEKLKDVSTALKKWLEWENSLDARAGLYDGIEFKNMILESKEALLFANSI
jgi:hypothetical protein